MLTRQKVKSAIEITMAMFYYVSFIFFWPHRFFDWLSEYAYGNAEVLSRNWKTKCNIQYFGLAINFLYLFLCGYISISLIICDAIIKVFNALNQGL